MKKLLLTSLLLLLSPVFAGVTERVHFEAGASGATMKNSVVRGERDVYLLNAGAGQTMKVKIYSLENNAVFQIKTPSGSFTAGAADGDDAMVWLGKLPDSGDYKVIVGGTRGNATYTLMVEIR